MLKIIRFFWGYVVFTATGAFPERFMNLTARAGIGLFNVKKCGNVLYCSTMASEYRALKKLAKKSSVKIKIREKHGFPFFIKKYKKRKGIFVGMLCFCLTLYFLSLYVWSIDVQGNTVIGRNEIDDLMNELGICVGTLKSELDIPMLEKTIMNTFDGISWVSVNVKGSTLSFNLKERIEPPSLVPKTKPCNIKASKDGQIIRMEVYDGTPEINNGDAVVKGQLLINGIVEDDFGFCNIRHADAKIYALTKHELKNEVSLSQIEKMPTGKTITRKRVKLFGLELPLTLVSIPDKGYEKSLQANNITVMGVALPITYYKEIWSQFYDNKITLTKDEALLKAVEALKLQEEKELKDVKIINCDRVEKVRDGKVIITGTYTCEENIAVQEEIMIEE